jgi:hypothetical protein
LKLRDASTWLVVCSVIAVVAVVALDVRVQAPGELSRVHTQDSRLSGQEGCAACHGEGSLASACASCHEPVLRQIEQQRGLHGTLPAEAPRDCVACHAEHRGADFEIAGARAFAAAGIPDWQQYDHAPLAFTLQGKHVELACTRCHVDAEAQPLPAGHARFSGLDQDCASCHEDPHGGRITRACADCHGQADAFERVAAFSHAGSFPLVGAHGAPSCLECHPRDGAHAVEVLAGPGSPPQERACSECHRTPHATGFIEASARTAGLAAGASCALCHDALHASFASPAATLTVEQHAASGFALDAPHARQDCEECHAPRAEGPFASADFASRYPGRSADDCAACHADPHAGEFERGAFSGRRCVDCHATHEFRPSRFDADMHALSGFALSDSHALPQCADCHRVATPVVGQPVRFDAVSGECATCHVDAHAGAFALTSAAAGCAACHAPTHFSAIRAGSFDHEQDARFALLGAHAALDCESCHPRTVEPDASGRRFGRVVAAHDSSGFACASCHADAHAGSFAAIAAARGLPTPDCARCHDVERFTLDVPSEFEHGEWTGFELLGAHARAQCAACHGSGATPTEPTARARRLGSASERFPGPSARCSTCHADPHDGRFDEPGLPREVEGRVDCARCHGSESFRIAVGADADRASFDHRLWTGWELAGVHAQAACAACHVPSGAGPLAPDERAGAAAHDLYPAVAGTACAACHADVHAGQFVRDGVNDCARCHEPVARFSIPAFDHAATTRFALDENHRRLACAACHIPQRTKTGVTAVRYRPIGTTCVDCHGVGGKGK